jgi:hypothetical protein
VEYKVEITIAIDILNMTLPMEFHSLIGAKRDAQGVYGGRVKGVGCQNSHGDYPFAARVDAVGEASGLDVDLKIALACVTRKENTLDLT